MNSGTFVIETFESQCLKGNPLNDPHTRSIPVFLPPGYENSQESYPVVYLLTGFSGMGIQQLNKDSFAETLEERINRLIASEQMKPAIVVIPDGFTYYGGSQYINSEATGKYETHILEELVPFIDSKYRTLANPANRAVMGKSSGGYGALVLALRNPEIFGVSASHSGDLAFEYCYMPDFPPAMIALEKFSGVHEFMADFYSQPKKNPASFAAVNIVGMSSCYSPNLDEKPHLFDLPFDMKTGEIREDVWNRWLKWDPLRMLDGLVDNANQVKFFLDCGTLDEHSLYAGSRMFSKKLNDLNIAHEYEEFVDNHRGISYRYDRSFEFMSKAFEY